MPFLDVLKKIIDSEEPEIIGWDIEGWFEIRDVDKFKTKVLPKHFKHSNFKSFIKQLNNYYFVREVRYKNVIGYRNHYFPEKMISMKRRDDKRSNCDTNSCL